jgi:hypothetical protein
MGNGRIICVHVLPVIYQITLLLFDGLADHILVEYANRWRTIHEKKFIFKHELEIKIIVLLLKSACQQYDSNDEDLDLDELLDNYLVGTSREKQQLKPPDYSKLRPLQTSDLRSCDKIAEDIIKHKKTNNVSEESPEEEIETTTEITSFDTYVRICKCINALKNISNPQFSLFE